MKSKLYKTKEVDLEKYTALELSFLMMDVFKEVSRRQKAVPKLLNELNKKTYELTHEIEFGGLTNHKEKADHFEVMEQHFEDRRLAKREYIVVDEVFDTLDFDPSKVVSKMGHKVKTKQNYFKLADGDRVITPKKWEGFFNNQLSIYL